MFHKYYKHYYQSKSMKTMRKKLTDSINIVLFFTKLGGILPVQFDGQILQYQAHSQLFSGLFLLLIIGGYLSDQLIIHKEELIINFQGIINLLLDLAQFIGSLCCFLSAVISQSMIRDVINKSFLIHNKLGSNFPQVWQVVAYIMIEMTEIMFPPRGLLPAIGKLQIVCAVAVLATLMIILEKSFDSLNQQIKHFYSLHEDLNAVSGLILVSSISRCRFLFTIHLYRFFLQKFPVSQFFWAFLSFQPIFFLCHRFESLQTQAIITKNLLNELDLILLDQRSQVEVKLLLLQTESYSWNITPMGLFSMNFNLVITVIMTTLTYIILLKQMIGK
ncbi:uncharacterized protein LOC142317404 isoform X3 [Lycorma delicatula]|uniref:uncharacterized protein LOC142317404 isoform X3 n=1 Tax=Lycorma delicatula TaxID=130591 RepID=UPI003F50D8C4